MVKTTTKGNGNGKTKHVTRYTYDEVKEPRTPETGHTALLPADERPVVVDLDLAAAHTLL